MLNEFFLKFFGTKTDKPIETESKESRNVTKKALESYNPDFQFITAKDVAKSNGIEYVSNARGRMIVNGNSKNSFYAGHGKYILLHPANDGMPTCPIEWYGKFDGKIQLIMDNQSSFKCITNLNEILLQMVQLYSKYIDEEMFIAAEGFAIRLEDTVCPNYTGRASLVLTKDSIRNSKVKSTEIIEAKKYFINEFLDHYIGWNFGGALKSNPELEKAFLDFNALVISKGLREYAGSGLDVVNSKDVQPYFFDRA